MSKQVIMAIGAHIGDMELTCGGVLATHAMEGSHIITVALTAGEKGNPADLTTAEYRKQKICEAEEFVGKLGGESIVFNWGDGLLKHDDETVWAICDLLRKYRPDIVITHWKESIHKDHANTSKIVSEARYYAANFGFERELPAHSGMQLFFTENWEDAKEFQPYVYMDITRGYEIWYEAVKKHWFVTHSKDFRYLEYYDALSICRGCEAGMGRAQTFMVRDFKNHCLMERF